MTQGRPNWCRGRCQWGSLQWVVEVWGLGGGHGRSGVSMTGVSSVHVGVTLLWLGRGRWMRGVNVHVISLSVKERCNSKGQGGACRDRRAVLLFHASGIQSHEGKEGLSLHGVEGAGNGLESSGDSGSAVSVIGND